MFERFTDEARKTMALANQEAQHFHHKYIGTEHILLGLLKEDIGIGDQVLRNLDVDIKELFTETERLVSSWAEKDDTEKLSQTPRAKNVIKFAVEEARSLHHNYIGTEHILLGLLREDEGIAHTVLTNLGLNLDQVRSEILKVLAQSRQSDD